MHPALQFYTGLNQAPEETLKLTVNAGDVRPMPGQNDPYKWNEALKQRDASMTALMTKYGGMMLHFVQASASIIGQLQPPHEAHITRQWCLESPDGSQYWAKKGHLGFCPILASPASNGPIGR